MMRCSFFVICPFLLLLSYGCAEEPAPAPAAAPSRVAAPMPKSTTEQIAEPVQEPDPPRFVYTPGTRRDPFVPLLALRGPVPQEPDTPLTPLQNFDLSQLRLIGIITGKGEPRAMVIAPDGKSYILRKGVKIGKNYGVVIEVQREQVLVEEKFYDFTGEVRKNIQEIQLPKREGV
jgi:type IV pilus assembly protein PilP